MVLLDTLLATLISRDAKILSYSNPAISERWPAERQYFRAPAALPRWLVGLVSVHRPGERDVAREVEIAERQAVEAGFGGRDAEPAGLVLPDALRPTYSGQKPQS